MSGRFDAILSIIGGAVTPDRAIAERQMEVTGDRAAFREFPQMFEVGKSPPPDAVRAAGSGAREE